MDNSVNLHEYLTFAVGIFIVLKRKLPCSVFDVDMCVLIGQALKQLYNTLKMFIGNILLCYLLT